MSLMKMIDLPLRKPEIEALIPHRAPMLLVDTVTKIELTAEGVGSEITAERFIAPEDPILGGHFPGYPVYPGVLSVEAMAQSAAILTSIFSGKNSKDAIFLFMGIENVRFRQPVLPGQTLTLSVKMEKSKSQIYWFTGTASVDGNVCAEASFMAKHQY